MPVVKQECTEFWQLIRDRLALMDMSDCKPY